VGKGPELVAGVQQLTAPLLFPEESVERSLQESAADDMVRMGGGTGGAEEVRDRGRRRGAVGGCVRVSVGEERIWWCSV
jgi:hypothetical protein